MATAVTKRTLGLAGLAAFGACAALCAVPLLAAATVGGGLLSAIAAYVPPGAELVAAGAFGVGVLGVLAVRARRKNRGTGGDVAYSVDGGCGCGPKAGTPIFTSPDPAANEPIVCTADLQDKPAVRAQLDGYRAAFEQLRSTTRFAGGFRWVFATRPGLEAELRKLAENEHQCCRFFKFDVRNVGDSVIWETTGDERSARVLEEFAQLPTRFSEQARGEDAAALKRSARAAGLVFAADRPSSK